MEFMSSTIVAEQLKVLVALQAVDAQIYRLRKEKGELPRDLATIQEQYRQQEKACKALEEKLKATQVKQKGVEVDLAAKEQHVSKLQAQLYLVKTNKEYTALQHEIQGLKADDSLLEEEIIKRFDEIDQAKGAIAQEKATLTAAERELRSKEQEVQTRLAAIDAELARLHTERHTIAVQAERPLLTSYERILQNKNGLAIVPIVNDACQGCFMNPPPQVLNEVRLKEKVIICENCARILYSED